MKTLEFQLDDGDRNGGTVHLPDEHSQPMPVIIFCHAWGGNRTMGPSAQAVCREMLRAGGAMVTFDFHGCGPGQSFSEMTYGRWTRNLADVVAWVAQQEWADSKKVGCFAISSGTTPALRFAETSDQVAFVVSVATCLGALIGYPRPPGLVLVENWDKLHAGGTADLMGIPFPLEFYQDFIGSAPVYRLREIKCPVFFLTGANDNAFRLSDARLGFEILNKHNLPVKALEVEGSGHNLDETPERCGSEVVAWLRELGVIS